MFQDAYFFRDEHVSGRPIPNQVDQAPNKGAGPIKMILMGPVPYH